MVAESIRHDNNVSNVLFANLKVTPSTFKGLPSSDVIIFLSVFHHLVRYDGLDYAMEFMRGIASKNNKFLVFETGQPDEHDMKWAQEIDFIGANVEAWVRNMLMSVGYDKVRVIGSHKAVKPNTKRLLFLAEK